MRHRTKELVTILIAPMAVCGLLIALLFIMVVVAQAATTTVLIDAPCVYAGTTLDCRATPPPPPPPPPPTDNCGAFSRIVTATWNWSGGARTIDTAALGGVGDGILVVSFNVGVHQAGG